MKIAILDDERTQLQLMEQALIGGGSEDWGETVICKTYSQGLELLEALKTETFDCLVLDRQLPDMSGDVILQWVRQYGKTYTPVVMVTSLRAESEVVKIIEAGADDYITKPFRPMELVARVRRLIQRVRALQQPALTLVATTEQSVQNESFLNLDLEGIEDITTVKIAGYDFDRFGLTVTFNDRVEVLTNREFNLALLFFRNLDGLLSRPVIFNTIWKREDVSNSRALDTHVYRLRAKLMLLPENGFILRPVYGYGYRLDTVQSSESTSADLETMEHS